MQYKEHEKLKYFKLSIVKKIYIIVFFIFFPIYTFLGIFFKRINNKNIYIIEYNDKFPYKVIYSELRKNIEKLNFIKLNKIFIPIIPIVLVKDYFKVFIFEPKFFIKNILFFAALLVKISKYYYIIKNNNVKNLIVLQEYSFYMSYLTKILESQGGKLYNIMHGIPGDTYCYFRFSKCFVWGKYFISDYISKNADKEQFIISGSIYHNYLINNKRNVNNENKIDILYIMAGKMKNYDKVIKSLESLSNVFIVRILQHPRHYVKLNTTLIESKLNVIDSINSSKLIVGHYSTGLFDSLILGKQVISYLEGIEYCIKYVNYLDKSNIVFKNEELVKLIYKLSKEKESDFINQSDFINTNISTYKVLKEKIFV